MKPEFIGTFPPQFDTNAIQQEVDELERGAVPNVEWKWRFAALAAGAGPKIDVKVTFPTTASASVRPDEYFFVPNDTQGARIKLKEWFRKTHGQPTIDDAMDLIERTT